MNLKNEKGFTGVDIAIAIVVLFIFVSIIASLVYSFNSNSKELELKTEATYLAISEIETIKNNGFEVYANRSVAAGNSVVVSNEEIENKQGFFRTIVIEDYTDLEGREDRIPNLVKKATVKITYMFKGKEQIIELSTTLSKESLS